MAIAWEDGQLQQQHTTPKKNIADSLPSLAKIENKNKNKNHRKPKRHQQKTILPFPPSSRGKSPQIPHPWPSEPRAPASASPSDPEPGTDAAQPSSRSSRFQAASGFEDSRCSFADAKKTKRLKETPKRKRHLKMLRKGQTNKFLKTPRGFWLKKRINHHKASGKRCVMDFL